MLCVHWRKMDRTVSPPQFWPLQRMWAWVRDFRWQRTKFLARKCVWCAWGFFMSLLLFPVWEGCERVAGVALQCHPPLCVCVHVSSDCTGWSSGWPWNSPVKESPVTETCAGFWQRWGEWVDLGEKHATRGLSSILFLCEHTTCCLQWFPLSKSPTVLQRAPTCMALHFRRLEGCHFAVLCPASLATSGKSPFLYEVSSLVKWG